jgi:hypothetical protein
MNTTSLRLQHARSYWLDTWKNTDNTLLVTTIIGFAVLSILYLASRSSSNSGTARRPPHVSSWVPWLGSGIHLATNPDKFFDNAMYVLILFFFSVMVNGVAFVDVNMVQCSRSRLWGRR